MSIAATIYELSSEPLDIEERTKDYELEHFFHYQNPWLVNEGWPEPIDVANRADEIDALKASLPSGYSLVGEKITLNDPTGYWNDTIIRLEGLLQEAKQKQIDGHFYALGWWKDRVDGQHGILIYMRDTCELMTLNEFLLFMIPYFTGTDWTEFHIGSIFYCFN